MITTLLRTALMMTAVASATLAQDANEILLDHFDDGVLDSEWKISLRNAHGYTMTESGSRLTITDISPQVVHDTMLQYNAAVYLKRPVNWNDDFVFDMDFAWDALPEDEHPMQSMMIRLYNRTGDLVLLAGYRDCGFACMGSRYFLIGDGSHQYYNPGELPASGSASINIFREDGLITFKWNDEILLIGSESSCVTNLLLAYSYYPYYKEEGAPYEIGTSSFGSFSIDRIRIEGRCNDSDEDGLCDCWETECDAWGSNGIDWDRDGEPDLTLPQAHPDHKDLFIEVDRMAGVPFRQNALDMVRTAFANAPVGNPDNINGIDLHIHVDDTVPFQETIDDHFVDFNNIKIQYWGTALERTHPTNTDNILDAKKRVFRYCLFANKFDCNAAGLGEMRGNDFAVALGGLPVRMRTDHEMAVTFMHELGHNLGLDEGGGDDILFKPNHVSVMNYGFTEFQEDGTGDLLAPDYSREKMASLDESKLDETVGIVSAVTPDVLTFYGLTDSTGVHQGIQRVLLDTQPINWNDNLDFTEPNVAMDLTWLYPADPNYNPPTPGQVLHGHDDWANLELAIGTTGAFADRVVANLEPVPMTVEVRQWIREQVPHIPMLADFNDDRRIDLEDFAAFAAYWQEFACGDCGGADFTNDGSVTFIDLVILAQRWLIGT